MRKGSDGKEEKEELEEEEKNGENCGPLMSLPIHCLNGNQL